MTQYLNPAPVTDATLVSSTLAENDFAAWSAATAYAVGNRVIRATTHRIYERLIAGTTATTPEADLANWKLIGPTNRWAMFDPSLATASTGSTSISVAISGAAVGIVTGVVLLGVVGSQVQVFAGATLVRTVAVPAPVSPSTSSTVMITGLSINSASNTVITVTGSALAIAHISVGAWVDLGETLDCEVGITDFSTKSADGSDIQRAGYSRKLRGTVSVLAADIIATRDRLESLRGGAVVFWSLDDTYEATRALGWLSDFSFSGVRPTGRAQYSISIEGLTRDDATIAAGTAALGTSLTGGLSLQLGATSFLVPADSAGVVSSYAGATSAVLVTQGTQDVTGQWSITTADTNCTSTFAGGVITVTALSADAGYVTVTATRAGYTTLTGRFSIAKAKGGAAGAVGSAGTPGVDGDDALSLSLSNGAHVLAASSAGVVSSFAGATTTATVYKGQAVDTGWAISKVDTNATSTLSAATVTVTAMAADVGYVDVSATKAGNPTLTARFSISKARAGATGATGNTGPAGGRSTVQLARAIAGATWSDAEANAALTANSYGAPISGDVVTLYNSGSTPPFSLTKVYSAGWQVLAAYLNGALLVNGTVIADKIDSRGLSIRDASGNVILAAGSALPTAYAAAGTLNSEVCGGNMVWGVGDSASSGPGQYGNAITLLRSSGSDAYGFVAGDVLTISADVWCDSACSSAGQNSTVFLWLENAAQSWTASASFSHSGSTPSRKSATLTLPSDIASWVSIGVGVFHQGANAGTTPAGTVWAQRVQVERGPVATQYSPGVQPGATYGAPAGTYVGSTLAQDVEGNASTALANAGTAITNAANAQASANSALGQLQAIASDGILSRGEKQQTLIDWAELSNAQAGLVNQANAYGIVTERDAYTAAISALSAYLSGLSPQWGDTSQDTTIIPATWRAKWAGAYDARTVLLTKIAAVAGMRADWASVGGAGKPENNATVGARAGVNLVDFAGAALNDMAIKNSAAASGTNLVYNDCFEEGFHGWGYGLSNIPVSSVSRGIDLNSDYRLVPSGGKNTSVQYLRQAGGHGGDAAWYAEVFSDPIPVEVGKRYIISAYTAAHRCTILVFAYFYANEVGIVGNSLPGGGDIYNDEEAGGGQIISGYKRIYSIANIPSNAQYMRVILRKCDTKAGGADSYMFFTRVQAEGVGSDAVTPGPWAPSGISNPTAIRNSNPISSANVATYVSPGAIGNTQIGGTISSDNYVADSTGWAISKGGTAEFAQAKFRGSIYGGAFTGWAWPAAGQSGYYLGSEGLLMGNANGGRYVQISSNGSMTVGSGTSGQRTEMDNQQVRVYDSSGVLRVRLGVW